MALSEGQLISPPSGGRLGGVKQGTNITIAADGTISSSSGGGTVTSVAGSGSVSGITLTGTVTSAGTLTLGGALLTPQAQAWWNNGFVQVTAAGNSNVGQQILMHSAKDSTGDDVILNATGLGALTISSSADTTVTSTFFNATKGFSGNGSQLTALNASNISSGTLPLARGGTGATDQPGAANAILPSQSSQAGKFLTTNGSAVSWGTISSGTVTSVATGTGLTGGPITTTGTISLANTAVTPGSYTSANITVDAQGRITAAGNGTAGTVTSVAAGGGTTGLTFSGSPITSSGTLTLGGTLALANGGTGATDAQNARNNLLPTQTGNSGKFLSTDGTNASWSAAGTGTITSVTGTGTVNGITLSGSSSSGAATVTLGGAITTPTSANWFNDGFLKVRTDGVVQTGRYLDFHSTSTSSTFDIRFDAASNGNLNITAQGSDANVTIGGVFKANSAVLAGSSITPENYALSVSYGGIESRPGGSASNPGFKLNAYAKAFFAGLYLNVSNEQLGFTVNGDQTFLLNKDQITAKPDLLCQGSLIASNRIYTVSSGGGTSSSPIISIQRTSATTPGHAGTYINVSGTELRMGFSTGTTFGSLSEVAYFGPTTANIVGKLQGTTNFTAIAAADNITSTKQITGYNFATDTGKFTAGNGGVVGCTNLNSSNTLTANAVNITGIFNCANMVASGEIETTDIKLNTTKTGSQGIPCVFNSNNYLVKNTSALRFKKDVIDCPLGLDFVLSNRSVQYRSAIKGEEDLPVNYGFIADEFEESHPELVIFEDERVFSFKYNAMHGIHHKAIQDLNTKLEEENAQLRSVISDLVARVEALEAR